MVYRFFKNTFLLVLSLVIFIGCGFKESESSKTTSEKTTALLDTSAKDTKVAIENIVIGANQTEKIQAITAGKSIGIVANQTSVIFKDATHTNYTHVVDSLLQLNVAIKTVFSPEHGFRGKADAGELVKHGKDIKTGLPIISLYGKNKKAYPEQLEGLDMVIFDIQDVGARFYTYISTLHYVMEACAENNIPVLVLDRPNPNGHYIDGPILEKEHKSFIGMHPIPVVHGMTIAEYAQMINGEQWLANGVQCDLKIIPMKHYTHDTSYDIPIPTSPNMPNAIAVNLYASLCFFEGTTVSVGRGTAFPFQVYGSPDLPESDFSFTPKPTFGAKYPKHDGKLCYGEDLRNYDKDMTELNISWLINAYKNAKNKSSFFNKDNFIYKLAGTKKLQEQIEAGQSEAEIKASWQEGLTTFKNTRAKYLLYK